MKMKRGNCIRIKAKISLVSRNRDALHCVNRAFNNTLNDVPNILVNFLTREM